MKYNKFSLISVAVLGGLMAFSPLAKAEDADTDVKSEQNVTVQKKRPDPLQRLDKALTLTDDQKAKIKPILEDQATKLKAIRENAADDRKGAAAQARKLTEETNAKIKALLNPEQQTKFTQMLEKQRTARAPQTPPAADKATDKE
jgi:periplasmic protein CpxP/Spy